MKKPLIIIADHRLMNLIRSVTVRKNSLHLRERVLNSCFPTGMGQNNYCLNVREWISYFPNVKVLKSSGYLRGPAMNSFYCSTVPAGCCYMNPDE
jgi:hypothetical protein